MSHMLMIQSNASILFLNRIYVYIPIMYNIPMGPLDEAIIHDHTDAVRLLLEHGARKIYDHYVLLSHLASMGNVDIIAMLCDYGLYEGYEQILSQVVYDAVDGLYTNRHATVELLLKCGANVDYKGLMYNTPLRIACYEGDVRMARLLLDHGANPLSGCSFSNTPLDAAIEGEYDDIVEMLLRSSDISKNR